jgi:hypothetical protein
LLLCSEGKKFARGQTRAAAGCPMVEKSAIFTSARLFYFDQSIFATEKAKIAQIDILWFARINSAKTVPKPARFLYSSLEILSRRQSADVQALGIRKIKPQNRHSPQTYPTWKLRRIIRQVANDELGTPPRLAAERRNCMNLAFFGGGTGEGRK